VAHRGAFERHRDGPPVYHFKTVIPVAGALVSCRASPRSCAGIVCLKPREWPSRLKDVAEIDVIEEQLAHSEYVTRIAQDRIERAHESPRRHASVDGGSLNK